MHRYSTLYLKIFLQFLLLSNILSAQTSKLQIIDKPEKSTSEIVAVRDANGCFCAGIKVISDGLVKSKNHVILNEVRMKNLSQLSTRFFVAPLPQNDSFGSFYETIISNLEGFSYDSYNGIVRVDKKPGQDMVYISSSERVLEIFCSGYEPLKIVLQEVGIILNPKDVWIIKIYGEKIEELTSSKKGHISLKILPEEANAYFKIEGLPVEGTSPYEAELIAGKYKIFINPKSPFYNNKVEELTIKEGETTKKVVNLEDISGHLFINVSQKPIKVFIDDEFDYVLSNERQKRLVRGEYKIRVEKDGEDSKFYNPSEEIVKIEKGEDISKTFRLEDISGYLEINSNLKEIKAYINGEYAEELSSEFRKRLISGKYDIKIESKYHVDSYSKFHYTVNVEKGKTEIIRGGLIPKYGSVSLISNINNVIYSVIDLETDRCVLKSNNIDNESLLIGKYELQVDASSEGYLKKPEHFEIKENENKSIKIIFTNDENLAYKETMINSIYNITKKTIYGNKTVHSIINKHSISTCYLINNGFGINYYFWEGLVLNSDFLNVDDNWFFKMGSGKLLLSQYLQYCELINLGTGFIIRTQNHKNRFIGEISIGVNNIVFFSLGRYSFPREKMYNGRSIIFIDTQNDKDLENIDNFNKEYFTKYIPYSGEISFYYERYIYSNFYYIKIGAKYIVTSGNGTFLYGDNIMEDWHYKDEVIKYRDGKLIYTKPLNIEKYCYFFPFISIGVKIF